MGTLSPQKQPLGAAILSASIRYDKDENDSRWSFSLNLRLSPCVADSSAARVAVLSSKPQLAANTHRFWRHGLEPCLSFLTVANLCAGRIGESGDW